MKNQSSTSILFFFAVALGMILVSATPTSPSMTRYSTETYHTPHAKDCNNNYPQTSPKMGPKQETDPYAPQKPDKKMTSPDTKQHYPVPVDPGSGGYDYKPAEGGDYTSNSYGNAPAPAPAPTAPDYEPNSPPPAQTDGATSNGNGGKVTTSNGNSNTVTTQNNPDDTTVTSDDSAETPVETSGPGTAVNLPDGTSVSSSGDTTVSAAGNRDTGVAAANTDEGSTIAIGAPGVGLGLAGILPNLGGAGATPTL